MASSSSTRVTRSRFFAQNESTNNSMYDILDFSNTQETPYGNGEFKMKYRKLDGYVHVTHLLKAHKSKRFDNWIRLENVQCFIRGVANKESIPYETDQSQIRTLLMVDLENEDNQAAGGAPLLMSSKHGKVRLGAIHRIYDGDDEYRGIWVHPKIALELVSWLNIEFKLWAIDQLKNFIFSESSNSMSSRHSENSCVDLCKPQSFLGDTITDIKTGDLEFKMRELDGYVYATGLCEKYNRGFNRFWVLESKKKLVQGIARELDIPVITETTKTDGINNCYDLPDGNVRQKLGAVHYVKHGPVSVRGYWVHPRVALEIIKWISLEFEIYANGILYRFVTGQVTTEESQRTARILFRHKGRALPSLSHQEMAIIYFAKIIGCLDKEKFGKTMRALLARHDAQHARSYDPITLAVAFVQPDTTHIETALITYLRTHNLMDQDDEHYNIKAVQEHFGFLDKEAYNILASLILHAGGAAFVISNPLNPDATKVNPEEFAEYCDIDEDKINKFQQILDERIRLSKKKRRAPVTDDSEIRLREFDHDERRQRLDHELEMKRIETENQKIELECKRMEENTRLELESKRLTVDLETQRLNSELESKRLNSELEQKRMDFEREKWLHEKDILSTQTVHEQVQTELYTETQMTQTDPLFTTVSSSMGGDPLTGEKGIFLVIPKIDEQTGMKVVDRSEFCKKLRETTAGRNWNGLMYSRWSIPQRFTMPSRENSDHGRWIALKKYDVCPLCECRMSDDWQILQEHLKIKHSEYGSVRLMNTDWINHP